MSIRPPVLALPITTGGVLYLAGSQRLCECAEILRRLGYRLATNRRGRAVAAPVITH